MPNYKPRHVCTTCRHLFDEKEMFFTANPWDQEMHGDNTLVWLCKPCYNTALDEV